MLWVYENVKYRYNQDIGKAILNPNSFLIIISIINIASSDFKNLHKKIKKNIAFSKSVNLSFLKENIKGTPLLNKIKKILHGPIHLSIGSFKGYNNFNLELENTSNYYIVGIIFNNYLYYPTFLSKFNGLTTENTFFKLLNLLIFKQSLLFFYFLNIKLSFFLVKK